MSQCNLKFYLSASKNFAKSQISWRHQAKLDSLLTNQWLDKDGIHSHKVVVEEQLQENSGINDLHGFLDGEYGKSMLSVDYKKVSYIPSENFAQIGLFAKNDIAKGLPLNGVIGFLAEILDHEIVEGFNDVSILYSSYKNSQWMMLGPIFFINASCKPNVEYTQCGKIVLCVAKRDIRAGEELSVFYNRHFFGRFNIDCLCPHKIEHGDPCPKDPEPARKRKFPDCGNVLTPKNLRLEKLDTPVTPVRKIFIEKLPPRRVLYGPLIGNVENKDQSLSYESVFGEIELSLSPVKQSTPIAQKEKPSFSLSCVEPLEDNSASLQDHLTISLSTTPVRLDLIDAEEENVPLFEPDKVSLFQEEGLPLFPGSQTSTENFFKEFESLSETHKFSKAARADMLKLISKNLPVPNSINAKLARPHLPTLSLIDFGNAQFCCVDIKTQIERVLTRNAQYVLSSWNNDCSWSTHWDSFRRPVVQIVLNIDGAPVFKSTKLAVWPIWLQVFNLPPKLRLAFSNLCLLGLWHGKFKPDFSKLLPLICFELESLIDAKLSVECLGVVEFRVRSLVADMRAKACVLCMNQFNGYSSCPHCYMRGFYESHRMLFPVKKGI